MIMKIFDYNDQVKEINLPDDKQIEVIYCRVLSGDETGFVWFTDKTRLDFDASDFRIYDFDDGDYHIMGKDIQKWLNWEPKDNSIAKGYERQKAFRNN